MACPGSNNAPTFLRDRAEQFKSARHHAHSILIGAFACLEFPRLNFRIKMRSNHLNDFSGADPVSDCHYRVAVNSMLTGPSTPLTFDRLSRIHENTVKVEEDSSAVERDHW
jgi:hypothetical protein